jgi:hypothetical protein
MSTAFREITTGIAPLRLNVEFTQPIFEPSTSAPSSSASFSPPVNVDVVINDDGQEESIPAYKMSRAVKTVSDLIREWEDGLGGHPSVKSLENTYQRRWRVDATESKYFNRRKPILSEYESLISEGSTRENAIRSLNLLLTQHGGSLDSLQKYLRTKES